VLQAINYGTPPFSLLNHHWETEKETLKDFYCIWDQALFLDVRTCLLRDSIRIETALKSVDINADYKCDLLARRPFEDRIACEDFRLVMEVLNDCREFVASQKVLFPHSYVVNGFVQLVRFLREKLGDEGGEMEALPNWVQFTDQLMSEWDGRFACTTSILKQVINGSISSTIFLVGAFIRTFTGSVPPSPRCSPHRVRQIPV
jgi:hypothetical protein